MSLSRIVTVSLAILSVIWLGLAIVCLLNFRNQKLYLIDIFTLPILSACLIWTVIMVLAHQKSAGLISGLALAGLLFAYYPQVFPSQPKPAVSDHPPIRILFNNLYIGNQTPEAIAPIIASESPDIVVLVEARLHYRPEVFKALVASFPYSDVYYDRVVLSRFPIVSVTYAKGLNVTRLQVKTPQGPMELIVVHLTRPWPFKRGSQQDQVRRLTDFLSPANAERMLVFGDFNSTPSASLLRDFAKDNGLKSAPALWGTWPSTLPGAFRIGIDNGFSGSNWSITDRRLGANSGSDHLPVIYRIEPARQTPDKAP